MNERSSTGDLARGAIYRGLALDVSDPSPAGVSTLPARAQALGSAVARRPRHGTGRMSFIDWSDSETMYGLLLEYVADERGEAGDTGRRAFLETLEQQLHALQGIWDASPSAETIGRLRAVHRSIPDEFRSDPVVEHLGACVDELERIQAAASDRTAGLP